MAMIRLESSPSWRGRRGSIKTLMKYRLFIIEGDPKTGERYLEALRKSEDFDGLLAALATHLDTGPAGSAR